VTVLSEEVRRRLARVRLLLLDVDGVQTDGGLYYTETGAELRRFNVKDGTGIQRVLASGIYVAFVTHSSTPAIAARAVKLGITRCLEGISDKLSAVTALCRELGVNLSDTAFVGDDINDLQVLRAVGCPLTVADAVSEVVAIAIWQSGRNGGAGAVREACDLLLSVRSAV
jgi:3-deoxy-D-manno-octulosonate 8-phosphate phosphatase (KDO 8-P phosphatase)